MINLTVTPAENGAAKATVTFTDEATPPNAVTPVSAKWSLTDGVGAIINERKNVALVTASSISWLISGDDLQVGNYGPNRILTVYWTYNSTLGSNIPSWAQAAFEIEPNFSELITAV